MTHLKFSFSRLANFVLCFFVYIMAVSVLRADIKIESSDSPNATIGVHFSNITKRSILQRSDDLLNWTDILPAGNEVNEISLPDPCSKEKKALFYRLKAIEDPNKGRFYVNLHPTDFYLFSYTLGGDMLTVKDLDTGESVSTPAFSGGYCGEKGISTYKPGIEPKNGPLPPGRYYIVDLPPGKAKPDFYGLFKMDGFFNDTTNWGQKTGLRLHPGGNSNGCNGSKICERGGMGKN